MSFLIIHCNHFIFVLYDIQSYIACDHNERTVSYLPLSHIAAQVIDNFGPMYIGSSTYFAQPDALKGSLTATLKDVKPTIFFGVPRVWEKIAEKMQAMGRETTGIKVCTLVLYMNCVGKHLSVVVLLCLKFTRSLVLAENYCHLGKRTGRGLHARASVWSIWVDALGIWLCQCDCFVQNQGGSRFGGG